MNHNKAFSFFAIILFALEALAQSPATEIVEHYDTNLDGYLDQEEFTDYFIDSFGGEEGMHAEDITMETSTTDQHDHKIIRQTFSKQTVTFVSSCPLPQEIFESFDADANSLLNSTEFESAMPQILYMIMEGCTIIHAEEETCPELEESLQWISGILASIVVSLVSLVGIVMIPTNKQTIQKFITGPLVAFGVGALLGDALLHLIPHSLEADDSLGPPFMVLVAIFLFYVVEKYIHHFHGFMHHHHHTDKSSVFHNNSNSEDKSMNIEEGKSTSIKPVGYLSLMTDGIHNLIDGIAIGAAFGTSFTAGLATTIAVVIHEVPQEFGDFAILIESGFSKKKALLFNLFSATSCIIGSVIGLAAGASEQADAYILTLVAGGFLYISLAGMIPEIKKSVGVKDDLMHFGAILLGFFIMFVLAYWIEEAFEVCGSGHDHE